MTSTRYFGFVTRPRWRLMCRGALEVLDELRARAGDTVAIAFNRALCLLEFGDVSAAHAEFRGLIKDAGAPVRLGAFIVDGVELFLKTTADPVPAELVPAILEIARFFNVDQRDRFPVLPLGPRCGADDIRFILVGARCLAAPGLRTDTRPRALHGCSSRGPPRTTAEGQVQIRARLRSQARVSARVAMAGR